jgi:peroxiredoxin
MRRQLALTAVVVAAAVIAGIGLFTILRTEPDAPAVASTEAPSRVAGVAPPSARPILDEAVRELDLVRPPRLKRAEDFTVALLRGEPLKLSEQRGKPVMINFWATWCAPCREEMSAMERLYRRHREHGFVLLAVSVDTDAALVRPFLERHQLTFPVALDSKMSLANSYGVRALPSSFLVDRDGNLAALALGPRAWDNRVAHALVEGMLAQ